MSKLEFSSRIVIPRRARRLRAYRFLFVLSALILLAGGAIQGQSLNGLPGLEFGASPDSVRAEMMRLENVRFDSTISDDTTLTFQGGRLFKEPVHVWVFLFAEGRLARISVTFKPDQHRVLTSYRRLATGLDTLYYPTTDRFELYEKPYRKGDGNELQAVVTGNGTIASFWTFDEKTPLQALMELTVSRQLTVTLRVENSALAARYSAKRPRSTVSGDR